MSDKGFEECVVQLRIEMEELKGDIRVIRENICWLKKMYNELKRIVYAILILVLVLIGKTGVDGLNGLLSVLP